MLVTTIGVGWKGLPGTDTLANYEHLYIADVKSVLTLGQDNTFQ